MALESASGFEVVNAHGPVGVVESVGVDGVGRPTSLVVRAGSTRSLVLLVRLDSVDSVDAASRTVMISEDRIGDYVPELTDDGTIMLRPPQRGVR